MARPAPQPTQAEFQAQLQRLLALPSMRRAANSRRLLEYLGKAHLERRHPAPSQYTLAYELLGLGRDFNPESNPVVRMQVARLRRVLNAHAADLGLVDAIRITIPAGSYHLHVQRVVPGGRRREAPPTAPSLALLEFRGLGLRDVWAHLPALLAEELSVALGRLPGLRVLGPFSRARLDAEGLDGLEVGRRHAVDFVLDGSLEAGKDRQVLRVRLLDGRTGAQVWSERLTCGRGGSGLAELELALMARVADELGVDYGPIHAHLSSLASVKPAAVLGVGEAIVTARAYLAALTPDLLARATLSLRQAIAEHPDEALPRALLSMVFVASLGEPESPPGDPRAELADLANQSYVLDPASPWSVIALAGACVVQGRDAELDALARRLESNSATPQLFRGVMAMWMLLRKVRTPDALALASAGFATNPHQPAILHMPEALVALENGDAPGIRAALAAYNWPGGWYEHLMTAAAWALEGHASEARRHFARVEVADPGFSRRGPTRFAAIAHPDYLAALSAALRRVGLSLPGATVGPRRAKLRARVRRGRK